MEIDVASVSRHTAENLKVKSWDVLQLLLIPPNNSSRCPHDILSCVMEVVVRREEEDNNVENAKTNEDETKSCNTKKRQSLSDIWIHPLMHEFLTTSYRTISELHNANNINANSARTEANDVFESVVVLPFPIPGWPTSYSTTNDGFYLPWTVRRIESIQELPTGSTIRLSILFIDDELTRACAEKHNFIQTLQSALSFFLTGRILMQKTTTLLSTSDGLAIASVIDIKEGNSEEKISSYETIYRLGDHENYDLEVILEPTIYDKESCDDLVHSSADSIGMVSWQTECPGYEKLLQSLVQLVSLRGSAAPSGIVLTGSAQVGKTHLASCLVHQLLSIKTSEGNNQPTLAHWVSLQDLILHAAWASESDLIAMLRPPQPQAPNQLCLLVIDDLQALASTEESAVQEDCVPRALDPEMLVVQNSVLQIIDEISTQKNKDKSVTVLAITQSISHLPPEFVRSGRLEKEIDMLPPTQSQRESILRKAFSALTSSNHEDDVTGFTRTQKWAEALSPVTVGCVAGDLYRILAAAWTRATARGIEQQKNVSTLQLQWRDLLKAAQTYIPVQLKHVDVCKPKSYLSEDPYIYHNNDGAFFDFRTWSKVHELSWESFGGYPQVKKRIWRTIIGPWRRFLASIDTEEDSDSTSVIPKVISPPPGVLFHGKSGNGKSFAASCIASSLQLPMLRVKASEVMDKWLGGSEAIIRSLFRRARSAAPCILLFDEIDAIATNRASGDEGGAEIMPRLLSTLLNEMDGISSDKHRYNVLVVACTNRLGDLDAALLRPGRLEEHIHLKNPTESDIQDILKIYLAGVELSDDIVLEELAKDLFRRQATGADVEGICHGACLGAVHRMSSTRDVTLMRDDFEKALHSSRLR